MLLRFCERKWILPHSMMIRNLLTFSRTGVCKITNIYHKNLTGSHSIYPRETKFPGINSSFHPFSEFVTKPLDPLSFDHICDDTLVSLCDYFEELIEDCSHLVSSDVTYGDGVLTVQFGHPYGTYVINRQTPNQQIWLSSPTSGPKRYDFLNNQWIYRHDGVSLHELLNKEISKIVKHEVDFSQCMYSGIHKQEP
uniref:ferroxidase n=1 Tax=Timema genevievae TaxID=629358 RepID=A0A7R9JPX4_TIMGE|nr:unnamed protein product [Timema genevievae]